MTVKAKMKLPVLVPNKNKEGEKEIFKSRDILEGKIRGGFFYAHKKPVYGIPVDRIEIIEYL